MKGFDPVNTWIKGVCHSHSNSRETVRSYSRWINTFLEFVGKSAGEIIDEYEHTSSDREFRRKYARYIRALIAKLQGRYAPGTITLVTMVIRSFFKYNDLPLGFVPVGTGRVIHHNRDITKEEVAKIIGASRPREKAFFLMMAQSGLRPSTLCMLKLKHISPDFKNGMIPCKIEVPQELAKGKYRGYFTFMGDEAVKALKHYFSKRKDLTQDSHIFTSRTKPSKRENVDVDPKTFSVRFNLIVRELKDNGELEFDAPHNKPAQIRLYNLRKYFRKFANQAGFEHVQYWMGHVVKEGVEEHYRPLDVEFHRNLYAKEAMPFLTIESATPNETLDLIGELKGQITERDQRIQDLEEQQKSIDSRLDEFKRIEEEIKSIYKDLKYFSEGNIAIAHLRKDLKEEILREIAKSTRQESEEKTEHQET